MKVISNKLLEHGKISLKLWRACVYHSWEDDWRQAGNRRIGWRRKKLRERVQLGKKRIDGLQAEIWYQRNHLKLEKAVRKGSYTSSLCVWEYYQSGRLLTGWLEQSQRQLKRSPGQRYSLGYCNQQQLIWIRHQRFYHPRPSIGIIKRILFWFNRRFSRRKTMPYNGLYPAANAAHAKTNSCLTFSECLKKIEYQLRLKENEYFSQRAIETSTEEDNQWIEENRTWLEKEHENWLSSLSKKSEKNYCQFYFQKQKRVWENRAKKTVTLIQEIGKTHIFAPKSMAVLLVQAQNFLETSPTMRNRALYNQTILGLYHFYWGRLSEYSQEAMPTRKPLMKLLVSHYLRSHYLIAFAYLSQLKKAKGAKSIIQQLEEKCRTIRAQQQRLLESDGEEEKMIRQVNVHVLSQCIHSTFRMMSQYFNNEKNNDDANFDEEDFIRLQNQLTGYLDTFESLKKIETEATVLKVYQNLYTRYRESKGYYQKLIDFKKACHACLLQAALKITIQSIGCPDVFQSLRAFYTQACTDIRLLYQNHWGKEHDSLPSKIKDYYLGLLKREHDTKFKELVKKEKEITLKEKPEPKITLPKDENRHLTDIEAAVYPYLIKLYGMHCYLAEQAEEFWRCQNQQKVIAQHSAKNELPTSYTDERKWLEAFTKDPQINTAEKEISQLYRKAMLLAHSDKNIGASEPLKKEIKELTDRISEEKNKWKEWAHFTSPFIECCKIQDEMQLRLLHYVDFIKQDPNWFREMKFINKEYIDQVKLELRAVSLKRQIENKEQRAERANKRTEQLNQRTEQLNQRTEQLNQRTEQLNQQVEINTKKQEQYKQHLEKNKQEIDELKKEKARLEKELERQRKASEKDEPCSDATVNINNKKTPRSDLFSTKTREQVIQGNPNEITPETDAQKEGRFSRCD